MTKILIAKIIFKTANVSISFFREFKFDSKKITLDSYYALQQWKSNEQMKKKTKKTHKKTVTAAYLTTSKYISFADAHRKFFIPSLYSVHIYAYM